MTRFVTAVILVAILWLLRAFGWDFVIFLALVYGIITGVFLNALLFRIDTEGFLEMRDQSPNEAAFKRRHILRAFWWPIYAGQWVAKKLH